MDIKQIVIDRDPPGAQAGRRWWILKPDEAAQSISANLTYWSQHQRGRHGQAVRFARMYGNLPSLGINGQMTGRISSLRQTMGERLTFNVVQSVIDTLTSKIARNKPKPLFLTDGGDYKQQRKAKLLTKFSAGVFYENKTPKIMRDAFRDALVLGDGIVHVFERNGRVAHERVLPLELWLDEVEAEMAAPRQMHRVKAVDRSVLLDMFPDKADIINEAASRDYMGGVRVAGLSDLITVRESWHLPSGPEADDGAHILTVDGHALTEMEPYRHDCFPFARISYSRRQVGFWSQGLAEQLQNIQYEINKLLWVVQRSLHLSGTFKIWAKNGSKVVIEQLNNEIGAILRSEEPPQWMLPQAVPPEIYAQLRELKQSAYDQSGVSQLSAQSQKPAGLVSGAALREYDDINTERFMTTGLDYEDFAVEIAKLSIMVVQDIVSRQGVKQGYKVQLPLRGSVKHIDWRDIKLDDDEDYIMQCFPISSLPSDPAGRLQTIQEYMQSGIVDQDTGRDLLDFPDLGAVEGLQVAQREWITRTLDGIVDNGDSRQPEPYMDLSLAHTLALEYYARGQTERLPEERLDLLRQWMTEVSHLVQQAMPPAPAGASGQPIGVPAAPPQSDLMPIAPGGNPSPGA
jgi:hypothetical protein